jgi:hypothetical protein
MRLCNELMLFAASYEKAAAAVSLREALCTNEKRLPKEALLNGRPLVVL